MHLVNQTIDWGKQPRALPHFTNGRLFCYSFLLTASVPQKEHDIFITVFMAQQCMLMCEILVVFHIFSRGALSAFLGFNFLVPFATYAQSDIIFSGNLYCVELLVGETPRGRANSPKMETGRLRMKYLLLRSVIDILVYL